MGRDKNNNSTFILFHEAIMDYSDYHYRLQKQPVSHEAVTVASGQENGDFQGLVGTSSALVAVQQSTGLSLYDVHRGKSTDEVHASLREWGDDEQNQVLFSRYADANIRYEAEEHNHKRRGSLNGTLVEYQEARGNSFVHDFARDTDSILRQLDNIPKGQANLAKAEQLYAEIVAEYGVNSQQARMTYKEGLEYSRQWLAFEIMQLDTKLQDYRLKAEVYQVPEEAENFFRDYTYMQRGVAISLNDLQATVEEGQADDIIHAGFSPASASEAELDQSFTKEAAFFLNGIEHHYHALMEERDTLAQEELFFEQQNALPDVNLEVIGQYRAALNEGWREHLQNGRELRDIMDDYKDWADDRGALGAGLALFDERISDMSGSATSFNALFLELIAFEDTKIPYIGLAKNASVNEASSVAMSNDQPDAYTQATQRANVMLDSIVDAIDGLGKGATSLDDVVEAVKVAQLFDIDEASLVPFDASMSLRKLGEIKNATGIELSPLQNIEDFLDIATGMQAIAKEHDVHSGAGKMQPVYDAIKSLNISLANEEHAMRQEQNRVLADTIFERWGVQNIASGITLERFSNLTHRFVQLDENVTHYDAYAGRDRKSDAIETQWRRKVAAGIADLYQWSDNNELLDLSTRYLQNWSKTTFGREKSFDELYRLYNS